MGVVSVAAVTLAYTVDQGDVGGLDGDFAALEHRIDAVIGIAVVPVGGSSTPLNLGQWRSGPAWSTMKVPLVMAALRAQGSPHITPPMADAITRSDNAAAEAIWAGLGDPATAARKVQAVLSQAGDPTVVQSRRVRPEYSAFGQTVWSLNDQAHFLAVAACDQRNVPVLTLMGQVDTSQLWGLGTLAGIRFKGGWGPYPSGRYLQRQMGLVTTPTGLSAVAIAAEPNSGTYNDAIRSLDSIASWLSRHLGMLPAGRCRP
ncbi:MAG: hypothetical protein U0Q47_07960 [Mycobacterium sp.]